MATSIQPSEIPNNEIRELLKEDFVESMLQADQGESEEMTQTTF